MQRGAPPFSEMEVVDPFRDPGFVGLCLKMRTWVSDARAMLRCGSERRSTRMVANGCEHHADAESWPV